MRCFFVLDLVILFYLFIFSLAAKLIGPRTGCQFFKNVDFLDQHPLNPSRSDGTHMVHKILIIISIPSSTS